MDLRKPHVADCMGLTCKEGLLGVLEGHIGLKHAIIHARVGSCKFDVLPTVATSRASDWMSSNSMSALLNDLGRYGQSNIIILDLPPLLTSDDVIAILPRVDCVLLVAAVGTSTVSDIRECNKHLQSTPMVRFVLNKAAESRAHYAYY
jgi:Mrp family chromosome partitioning ATPase